MSRYIVQFMKVVLGENGREAEICQRSMEVDAADKLKAVDWPRSGSVKANA
jgi:hypothetical protein